MDAKKHDIRLATLQIASVEKEFDVNSVTINGMKVWPLIRLALYDQLFWCKDNTPSGDIASFKRPKYDKKFPELPRSISKTDIMWFSSSLYYTDTLDGKYYSSFEDPFIELFTEYKVTKFEMADSLSKERKPRLHDPQYLHPEIEHLSVPMSTLPEIVNFDGLFEAIKSVCGVEISKQKITENAAIVMSYTGYFLDLLQVVRPRALFLICYYSNMNMAMVRACKILGIPTVEYQHGKQGKFHCMYSHWTTVPPEGYELLPRFFWNWGRESADNISKWMGKNECTHTTLVAGSPWLGMWVNDMWPEDREMVERFEQKFAGRKTILLSMQPYENLVEDRLVSVFKNSPEDWVWLLRLPPVHRNRVAEVVTTLEANGIRNYDIEVANNASLYTLLKRVDQQVTFFSSVCYEALSFGINSVLIYRTAKELYAEYIKKGYFHYAETPEEIIEAVKKGLTDDFLPEETPYIVTELKAAKKNTGYILAHAKLNIC